MPNRVFSVFCLWIIYFLTNFDESILYKILYMLYANPILNGSYCVQNISRTKWDNTQNFKFFLAHLAKGNVSFCHHLASVVRRLLL